VAAGVIRGGLVVSRNPVTLSLRRVWSEDRDALRRRCRVSAVRASAVYVNGQPAVGRRGAWRGESESAKAESETAVPCLPACGEYSGALPSMLQPPWIRAGPNCAWET
jgi:hypothetical protein